jgi:prevent-host-death family protein
MVKTTAADLAKHFAKYREIVQREPVAVTRRGQPTAYLVSPSEFEALQRYKALAGTSFATIDLTAEEIDAITSGRMSSEHDHLNALLDSD